MCVEIMIPPYTYPQASDQTDHVNHIFHKQTPDK